MKLTITIILIMIFRRKSFKKLKLSDLTLKLYLAILYYMLEEEKLAEKDIFLRPDHPDFLDLPWDYSLSEWENHCKRLEKLPVGISRHPVVFVNYDGILYALKELPENLAEKEYNILRKIEELKLPVVEAVGYIKLKRENDISVLITRYLDHSLPYYSLFMQSDLERYRKNLLDAMAGLLVRIHLSGVYWGDCSLSNTLFRRDAGALQAYLVDAETSEIKPDLSDNLREYDLDIMEENVSGALADLSVITDIPPDYPPIFETGEYIRKRYKELWNEITKEEVISKDEKYLIQERIRNLNSLGFSVDEIEIKTTENGEKLKLRAFVTDRNFHRDLLQNLTGIDAEEMQARLIVNEIQELKATMSKEKNRSIPLSVSAFQWTTEYYEPVAKELETLEVSGATTAELYCQVLEHKWFLSEKEQKDVGHKKALEDYIENVKIKNSKDEV